MDTKPPLTKRPIDPAAAPRKVVDPLNPPVPFVIVAPHLFIDTASKALKLKLALKTPPKIAAVVLEAGAVPASTGWRVKAPGSYVPTTSPMATQELPLTEFHPEESDDRALELVPRP